MAHSQARTISADYQIDRESLDLEYGSVNKAFLLRRGWTRTAIKRLLGEPDRRLVMRRFRKDRPECRYDMTRVLAAERAGKIRYRAAPQRRVPTWKEFQAAGGLRPEAVEVAHCGAEDPLTGADLEWQRTYRAKEDRDEIELARQRAAKEAAYLRERQREERIYNTRVVSNNLGQQPKQ